jgi:hypothetical protein
MKEIKKSASFKSKQRGKDVQFNIDIKYSQEYDSFIIKIKEGEGFMAYSSNIERMPLEVIQKLNEMLEEVLIKAGSETEMKEHKMYDGGDFQAGVYDNGGSLHEHSVIAYKDGLRATYFVNKQGTGYKIIRHTGSVLMPFGSKQESDWKKWFTNNVDTFEIVYADGGYFDGTIPNASSYMTNYAMGGSLEAHGIKVGDTFIKTMSGAIQKVKDKNGKIVYVNLSNGERSFQPLMPFNKGGAVTNERKHVNKDEDYEVRYAKPRPARKGYKGLRSFDGGGDLFEDYQNQPKELAEIVDSYMLKYQDGDFDYVDSRNFLKQVNAIGYTFDYGLDNEPYNLRPISSNYALGGLFGKARQSMKSEKMPNLEGKQVSLKNGKMVQVFDQNGSQLTVLELGKMGLGERPYMVNISEVDMTSFALGGGVNKNKIEWVKNIGEEGWSSTMLNKNAYENIGGYISKSGNWKIYRTGRWFFDKYSGGDNFIRDGYWVVEKNNERYGDFDTLAEAKKYVDNWVTVRPNDFSNGGALVGNQKRIDMNKNGKIDAEDFKLLRSSMNGAWRNERKHVNHNEKYEVRYAKPRPNRTGYKGKRKFGEGGGISTAERFKKVLAKNKQANQVKPKIQKPNMTTEGESKKGNRGGVMVLAKKIRKEGESWKDALKRAGQQLK